MELVLGIKNMKDFRDYKILLEASYFERYKSYLSSNKSNIFLKIFEIERIQIEEVFFSLVSIKYNEGEDLYINKKIFNIESTPQLFELKTKGQIYNFIDKSHFMSGFLISLFLLNDNERKYFIEELRSTNLNLNFPFRFDRNIKFALMCSTKIIINVLLNYNKKYNTDFFITETYFSDGEEFCVIEISSGSSLDLFCLGISYFIAQL